ncbi:hypothetical protein MFLAVUS_000709 [Mucor flavus]|uniref:Myb-like domain-containing protein n=1 Tax=Mucor flavus TaxID=439312 RepID=A0ABP9YKH2_9FUNG
MVLDFAFITRVDLLDTTFASIEKKLLRQPQINEWRIDVAPSHTDDMNAASSSTSMLPQPILPTPLPQPVMLPPTATGSSTAPVPLCPLHMSPLLAPNVLAQSCQILIQRQAQKIKELTEKATIEQNIMKSIYMLRREEERLQHLNEISIRDIQLKMLSKKAATNNQFINSIENIEIGQDDREKDKEKLLADKNCLMRKLKIAELRLHMQQVEINALRGSDNPSELKTPFYFTRKPSLIARHDPSPENQTLNQNQNDTSPDNQTITRDSTSPIPSVVQHKHDQPKVSASIVPRLSTIAVGLLKSTQQANRARTIHSSLSSSNPCNIETSPNCKKRKATTTDNDKKLKSIKLTCKSQWTMYEDQLLLDKVNLLGTDDWINISRFLPRRSSSECFLRYEKISAIN